MITPQTFKGLVTFIGKVKWPASPEPDIFLSVFIDIKTGRIRCFVVTHQEDGAFLNEEKYT